MGEQHDAINIAQSLGDPVVKRQIFRRALPLFTRFAAVVQVMQEMMRIVGSDCFGPLIRRKLDPVELRAVMVDQDDNVDRARLGCSRRAVGIVGGDSR